MPRSGMQQSKSVVTTKKRRFKTITKDQGRSKTWEKRERHTTIPNGLKKKEDQSSNVKYENDLNLFLIKIHQNPMHFKEEMTQKVAEFNAAFEHFKENSQTRDEKFARLTVFLANVIEYYQKALAFLVPTLQDCLSSYATVMHPFVRMKCVQTLTIIAKKGFWDQIESLNF